VNLVLALALAAVAQLTPQGFLLREEVTIEAPPAKVWAAIAQPGSWWSPSHTWSGDARNLSLDPRPGGCFCEKLPNGGGVEHLRVVYAAPNSTLRMSGALGPFQQSGVTGAMTWELAPAGNSTKLRVSYSVGGFLEAGFDKIAPIADGVVLEQVQRLKAFVETGKPEKPAS
jgi:uncharacterized protein YndB with AHSA1/START domain